MKQDLDCKVLMVSSYGPPHPGGLERAVERIYEGIKSRGVNIRWLLNDVPKIAAKSDTVRVKVWNFFDDRFGLPVYFPWPSAWLRLYREVSKCDLLHIHDGYYSTCNIAAAFARILRKRIVVTIHIWEIPYPNPIVQLVQKIALNLVALPTVLAADSIMTMNRRTKAALEARGKRTRYIANGVDPTFSGGRVPVLSSELRTRHGLPLDRPVAIFAGRYIRKKGLPVIQNIARALPDICFAMCGSGPESPDTWQLPNVINLGWTKSDKLRELFSCADLLLLPSRGEGFPLSIQEAMICGLPCAVFEETWEALGEKRDYFVILDDLPSPADSVRSFFARPRSNELSGEIAAYAKTNWTVDAMINSYLDVYAETLKP